MIDDGDWETAVKELQGPRVVHLDLLEASDEDSWPIDAEYAFVAKPNSCQVSLSRLLESTLK